jgi:hypothetical protein
MEFGSRAIHDILAWNDAEQVRQQGIIGKSLVKQFMDHYMPKATASNWSDVPGAVAWSPRISITFVFEIQVVLWLVGAAKI